MKKLLIIKSLIIIVVIAIIAFTTSCSKPNPYDCPPAVNANKQIHTEDMESLVKTSQLVSIAIADTVDGRVTYNVSFPDGTVLDSMYAEEIANGLITGKWDYNEDLAIITHIF